MSLQGGQGRGGEGTEGWTPDPVPQPSPAAQRRQAGSRRSGASPTIIASRRTPSPAPPPSLPHPPRNVLPLCVVPSTACHHCPQATDTSPLEPTPSHNPSEDVAPTPPDPPPPPTPRPPANPADHHLWAVPRRAPEARSWSLDDH